MIKKLIKNSKILKNILIKNLFLYLNYNFKQLYIDFSFCFVCIFFCFLFLAKLAPDYRMQIFTIIFFNI